MLLKADEDNDDVIESYSLYYIFSVFPSFCLLLCVLYCFFNEILKIEFTLCVTKFMPIESSCLL